MASFPISAKMLASCTKALGHPISIPGPTGDSLGAFDPPDVGLLPLKKLRGFQAHVGVGLGQVNLHLHSFELTLSCAGSCRTAT